MDNGNDLFVCTQKHDSNKYRMAQMFDDAKF